MFDALIFALGVGLAEAGPPATQPPPVAIGDLWLRQPATDEELAGNERCRAYNCGMPTLPPDLKRRLGIAIDEERQK